jgi:hypothetical protein
MIVEKLAIAILLFVSIMSHKAAACVGQGCDATASSPIHAQIQVAITIENLSPLDFGNAVIGDSSKTIPPSGQETIENASFLVNGQPDSEYRIVLPRRTWLYNIEDNHDRIEVSQFTSFPQRTGNFNTYGQSQLFVGATRERIALRTEPGTYSGQFSVTVLY